MAKLKKLPPRRDRVKDEGNKKALQITAISVGVLLVLLIALIIFVNN